MNSFFTSSDCLPLTNAKAVPMERIPRHRPDLFQSIVLRELASGLRAVTYFGMEPESGNGLDLFIVLARDDQSQMGVLSTHIEGKSMPSMTPAQPQLHLFEREIAEQFGIVSEGHPWFKPVRYHAALRKGADAWNRPPDQPILPAVGDFYRVEGDDIHEVGVGPVHAGIIEPGHFRFQCHGEHVFHLEIALGFQHRGIEKAMIHAPLSKALHYAENIAGDTAIGHATAFCRLAESLSGVQAPIRAQALRGITLELERLANHIGDLGALAGDIGFLPTSSYNGRIRGDFLNMTALFCGNRFGRGFVRPGGVEFDADAARLADLQKRLDAGEKDTASAVNLLFDTPSVLARFENKGTLPKEIAQSLGIVGPAARASGLNRDVRQDHPCGIYRFAQLPTSTWDSCDVFARAYVRWLEIQQSILFIREQAAALPAGPIATPCAALKPNHLALTLVEGWRGELCHTLITDDQGRIRRYKITDPSFHNWTGLAYAVRNQQISDFPLCNKSFNLSYCGHDL